MNKRKTEEIINNIVLSAKYERLKAEISDLENLMRDLSGAKKLIGTNDKKIENCKQFVEKAKTEIEKIERAESANSYQIISNGQLPNQLKLLEKQQNFGLIKYSIAIDVIAADDFEYADYTNSDFIKNFSEMLFDDNSVMIRMQDDYKRISRRILGANLTGFWGSAAKTAKSAVSKLINMPTAASVATVATAAAAAAMKPLLAISGIVGASAFAGYSYFSEKGEAGNRTTLSSGEFAKRLILVCLNLLQAKKYFETELEYRKYFEYTLADINQEREAIMKEMFEKHYEMEQNKYKIELLHNFDNYMIEQLLQKKQEEKKHA